eukprot:2153683-Rhodomonas_salina.1
MEAERVPIRPQPLVLADHIGNPVRAGSSICPNQYHTIYRHTRRAIGTGPAQSYPPFVVPERHVQFAARRRYLGPVRAVLNVPTPRYDESVPGGKPMYSSQRPVLLAGTCRW